jgi:hypothetical protein
MKHNIFLPLNLQFFAEEVEGAKEMESAEPSETVTENEQINAESEEENVSEPEVVQSAEDNARFAAARRAAEEQLKGYQQQQQLLDAEFERRFAGYTNPITGKPVKTSQDYLDALDAQQRLETNKKLEESGINPEIIENAINNNPVVKQAQEILQRNQMEEAERSLQTAILEISKLDSNIKTVDDLGKQPYADELVRLVNSGLGLLDAYKLANFDALISKKSEASKQAAINQAKGKSHLSTTDGVSNSDELLDIPEKELSKWRAFFPDASMRELKEKYNRTRK